MVLGTFFSPLLVLPGIDKKQFLVLSAYRGHRRSLTIAGVDDIGVVGIDVALASVVKDVLINAGGEGQGDVVFAGCGFGHFVHKGIPVVKAAGDCDDLAGRRVKT